MRTALIAPLSVGAFLCAVALAQTVGVAQVVYVVCIFLLGVCVAYSFFDVRVWGFAAVLCCAAFGVIRAEGDAFSFAFLAPLISLLSHVREAFIFNIERALPEPYAAYMAGITIGARSALPYDLKQAFRVTGTAHIIALSGYNISVIALYAQKILSSTYFSIGAIVLFVLTAGASSSVVRAAIMGILLILTRQKGASYHAPRALLYAMFIMVFVDPRILLHDIGFQLSVVATAGIIYFQKYIEMYLGWIPSAFGLRELTSITLAAEAATLPIVVYYFGFFSPFAPLVNILVVGTIPLTMLLGFLIGTVGFVSYLFSQVFAWPAFVLLSYQLGVIQYFAHVHVF